MPYEPKPEMIKTSDTETINQTRRKKVIGGLKRIKRSETNILKKLGVI